MELSKMTTIKYALREVRKYFGRYLPIYAQIITSVLVFAFIAVTFDQARVFSAKMYEYSEHKNMYAVVDKTDVPTIMNTLVAEGAEEKCKELYEYTAKNVEMYIHMKDKVRWNGKDIEVLQINKNFFDLYQINLQQGRIFYDSEWNGQINEDEPIPVLVGSEVAATYPIGTRFTNEVSDKSLFEIVGVLDKDAFYLEPVVGNRIISLNSAFIIPWIPRESFNNGYRNVNLFHVLQLETNSVEVLNDISAKSKELGLFDFDFVSFREQIEVVNTYYQNVYSRDCAMLGALLLYCVIGSITMLLQYINTHMKQNSIYMLCGATQHEIGLQMMIQILVPILIGLVFSAIIFKTAFAVIAGVLFGIVLLGVILFIPLLKWNRMEISQIFKTYE